jgi:hypothetical protein
MALWPRSKDEDNNANGNEITTINQNADDIPEGGYGWVVCFALGWMVS